MTNVPIISILVNFSYDNGAYPQAALSADANGDLFGTTVSGGSGGDGTVYEIVNGGTAGAPNYEMGAKTLYSFTGTGSDGANPYAGLIADANGNLFGTTSLGGTYGFGTVFEVVNGGTAGAPKYDTGAATLYSFTALGSDGANPEAGLIADANGDLFGTTSLGGTDGVGTAFEIVNGGTAGAPNYDTGATTLYSFTGMGSDGANPYAGLIADANGNLFGTTNSGGSDGYGAAFEIVNGGTVGKPKYDTGAATLYSFTGTGSDGANPDAGLIADANGNLFGTTVYGGSYGEGTVFEIVNSGTAGAPNYDTGATTLYSFTGAGGDGALPDAGLIADANGNLFGTTLDGGWDNYGAAFEIVNSGTAGAPNYDTGATTLYSFTGAGGDGSYPAAGLIADANGNLFGTTNYGGSHSYYGTVFEITNSGFVPGPAKPPHPSPLKLDTLVNFQFTDGAHPYAGLIADANGDLFGTTYIYGANNYGTVFEIKNNGLPGAPVYDSTPTTLVNFDGINGANPFAGLIADANGNLFGATGGSETAPSDNLGTVFEIRNLGTAGAPIYGATPTRLVSFDGTNGAVPIGSLIIDAEGDLFGTTSGTGFNNNDGTVFEIKNLGAPDAPVYASTPVTLVNFDGTNGSTPYASLIADANGDLFGTTTEGGSGNLGTVFEIKNIGTPGAPVYDSAATTLVSFDDTNGARPHAALIADAKGDLFGTTVGGGVNDYGTVFEIRNIGTSGAPVYDSTPTTLVSFDNANGGFPYAALIADANGDLFGTTAGGGSDSLGTVFEITNIGTSGAPVYDSAPTTLFSFDGTNGSTPYASLIADANGVLYGTTYNGGVNNYGAGTVFEISNSEAAICFMAGTLVRTPGGDVAIENLKRGDFILTSAGVAAPVSWLGRQTVVTRFADPLRSFPIRIRAGALSENVPSRDLLVSPSHALLVGDVLVQAGALLNGVSILREEKVPEVFVYYHVELDDHALILAENTPAETFVDNVERLAFDNWVEHEALYPDGKPILELPYPRAKARRQVPQSLRAAIEARAAALFDRSATAAA